VGLKPSRGWARRNYRYLTRSYLPGLLKKVAPSPFDHNDSFDPLQPGQLEITWVGHASFLARTPRHNLLIDPVWAKWLGPVKRFQDPGIPLNRLPAIDLILISHAHFDHLCVRSLRRICQGHETIIVPGGVSRVVRNIPCREVIEMSEWDHLEFGDLEIHFTPCHHWGARYLHDTHREFGGFLIKTPGHHLYHAGDSAYFEGFTQIGERHRVDTALLPIGAYHAPSGRHVHMNPEEALVAFGDLGARTMIPMHFGTFPLGIEHRDEPLHRLNRAVSEKGWNDRVVRPLAGERIRLHHTGAP